MTFLLPLPRGHGRALALACVVGVLGACSEDAESPSPPPREAASTPVTSQAAEPDLEALVSDALRAPVRGNLVVGAHTVVRVGEDSFAVRAGVANKQTGEPITARHRYVAADIAPVAVAVAVLHLMANGTVHPQDPVGEHLPGLLRNGDEITLEQLLTHASGLRNFVEVPGYDRLVFTRPARPELLVRRADALRPAFAPGSDTAYSGTNPMVLGFVVERVTGLTLGEALDRWVFTPAGMRDSSLGWGPSSGAPVAHGYNAEDQDVTNAPKVDWVWAAGGVVSTSRDVLVFYDALFGGELLPAEWLRRMTTAPSEEPPDFEYGYGLVHWHTRCGVALGDFGGIDGYQSHAWTQAGGERQTVLIMNTLYKGMATAGDRVVELALCSE